VYSCCLGQVKFTYLGFRRGNLLFVSWWFAQSLHVVCLLNVHDSRTRALVNFILIQQIQPFNRLGSILTQLHDDVKLLGGLVAVNWFSRWLGLPLCWVNSSRLRLSCQGLLVLVWSPAAEGGNATSHFSTEGLSLDTGHLFSILISCVNWVYFLKLMLGFNAIGISLLV